MELPRRALALDFALGAGLLVLGLPPALDPEVNDPRAVVVGPLLLPLLLVAIPLRRRAPVLACAVFLAACVVTGLPTLNQFRLQVAIPAGLVVAYAVARHATGWSAAAGLAAVLTGCAVVGATESVLDGVEGWASTLTFGGTLTIAVFAGGRAVRSRERLAGQLADRMTQLRRQREETAALAIEIDRDRVGTVIDRTVRTRLVEMVALAARDDWSAGTAPDRYRRIETLGREALDHMRGVLGRLRTTDRRTRSPRPTLEELDGLLDDARARGGPVEFAVEGKRRPLGAGAELTAFRMIQHGLTACRGATALPVSIRLRYSADGVEVEVSGRQVPGVEAGAAVESARERVVALGGKFTVEAPAPGRRVLRAQLPLAASSGA